MDVLDSIITERSLSAARKQERVDEFLKEQGREGIRVALDAIADAKSEARAAYAASYLAKQPGLQDEKNRAIQALFARNPRWVAAIASLVRFADDRTLELLIAHVRENPGMPGAHGVAYRLAEHFPDRMRGDRKRLANHGLFELLLPGAPDSWVKTLVMQYRHTRNGQAAIWLAKIGTESARQALSRLEHEASSSRKEFLAALLRGFQTAAEGRAGPLPESRRLRDRLARSLRAFSGSWPFKSR